MMGHDDIAKLLETNGALAEYGDVLVQDHVPKVTDFFKKDCWKHHPKPYQEFMDWRAREDAWLEQESKRVIPSL